ncbi:hypothetical protein CEUSTIGMA_g1709.t1 [Chlamydomonas eustigma]|uniref:PHD-type domain-containing protein n=1 Tax=Chlamydomonas eustigma TaxID=1157962 RepID=A0A250WUN2_9CHLO|nr:hypothetical protein CEUSTIGMA_g1709.t1 [Chlamydomonas eustigma]|eukprot:GAX74260.1 hypothetical protein CEUSTIGMA_g1709.t1 [Chlamydomonas eustigma]
MPPRGSQKLEEIVQNDLHFKIGDACLINPERGMTLPFVMLKVVWYYRPEEALGGRKVFHGEKELFESDHEDEIHKDTIIGKCFVHSLRKYEDLAPVTESDFYSRFMYRPALKVFEPDQVPVFCLCEQPYNPDKVMINCTVCSDWFHPNCLGMTAEDVQNLADEFFCPSCTSEQPQTKRPKVAD